MAAAIGAIAPKNDFINLLSPNAQSSVLASLLGADPDLNLNLNPGGRQPASGAAKQQNAPKDGKGIGGYNWDPYDSGVSVPAFAAGNLMARALSGLGAQAGKIF